jgi:glycosyltransferase involved in cell wall biosynthesis
MTVSVLHFSTADNEGGSGRSAYRIHAELRRRGNRSRMMVKHKVTDDPDVARVAEGRVLRRADEFVDKVTARLGLQYQAVPSSGRVLRHPWLAEADIIQLYNTHGGYLAHLLLPKIARGRPVVWRLSDMWPVTGHCAYASGCEKWLSGCGACPDLETYPAIGRDTTAWLWRQKRAVYKQMSLTVVAPSSWTEDVARRAPLFAGCAVHRVPNGLDLAVFRPHDRRAAREFLGVPQDCAAILYAPHVAIGNARKGTDMLARILARLGPRRDTVVMIAGVGGKEWVGKIPQTVIPLGYLQDDRLIAMANAAADIVVAPSTVENLPNSVIEALACARPVVAFDAGGMRDAVRNGETGLLVAVGDVAAFADALGALLGDEARRAGMGARGLDLAQREYCAKLQGERFEALYLSLLPASGPQ